MAITTGELAQLRTDQKAQLPDTCKVTRAGARGAFNEATGQYAPAAPATIYNGVCRAMPSTEDERRLVFGEEALDVTAFTVTLPHDAEVIKINDTVEMLTSTDPQLVGKKLNVRHIAVSSVMTARRVIVEVAE